MKRIKRVIAAVVIGMVIASQSLGFAAIDRAVEYPDISRHWAKSIMMKLNEYGVLSAFEDNTMRPEESVSTADFLEMTLKSLGFSLDTQDEYIKKATELRLIDGGEVYDYHSPLTRSLAAKILANALNDNAVADENAVKAKIYDYATIDEAYKPYVVAAFDKKILNGNEYDLFEPQRIVTRAEASVYLVRLIDKNGGIKLPAEAGSASGAGETNVSAAAAIYVAVNGSDKGDGSENAPFATLEKARMKVREMVAANALPAGGVNVYLRGGTYYIDNGLELTEADSGREGSVITYTAYPGEKVTISGMKPIDKSWFKPIGEDAKKIIIDKSAAGKVLMADLKANGITEYGEMSTRGYHVFNKGRYAQAELIVNGENQVLARYPNKGTISVPSANVDKESFGFTYTDDRISKWKDAKEPYIVGTISINYENNTYPVDKIDVSKKLLTVKEGRINTYYTNGWFFGQNLLEEIDMAGEYYIDREAGILYYYAPDDFMSGNYEIGLSSLETPVFNFNGAHHINVTNLTMEGGRGYAILGTSAGYKIPTYKEFLVANSINPQGNYFKKGTTSGIYLNSPDEVGEAQVFPGHVWDGFLDSGAGINNINVKNCNIFNFGSGGIIINGVEVHIENNHIKNMGGTGLYLRGGDLETLTPSGNTIINNNIHRVGYIQKSYVPAIAMHGVAIHVAHNDIYDAPHCVFNYHGNDHIIEYNKIHDAVKECLDMDAIYTRNEYMPQWRGNIIRNNYIYNLGIFPVGEYTKQLNVSAIRTDNYGHALQIYDNIFANIGTDNANNVIGITAQGNRNMIKGNLFVDCSATYLGWNTYTPGATWDMNNEKEKERVGIAEKYSQIPIFAEKYPELAAFKNEYYKGVATNEFDNNVVVNMKFKLSQTNGTVNAQGTRGASELIKGTNNYLTTSDPGFVNYAGGNYTLKPDSEVFKKIPDFKNNDMSQMGNNAPVGPTN